MLDKIRDFAEEYSDEIKAGATYAAIAVAYVGFCGFLGYVYGKAYARGVLAVAAAAVVA